MSGSIRLAALAASISLATLAACSQPKVTANPEATPAAAGTPIGSALDNKTNVYIDKAAQDAMYQVEAAKVAIGRAKAPAVKAFAQTMLDYHTTALTDLKPLAEAAAVTLPTALDAHRADRVKSLRDVSEGGFDDKYIDVQTAALSEARDTQKSYAEHGDSQNLKTLAGAVGPNEEMYLGQVKALDHAPSQAPPKTQ